MNEDLRQFATTWLRVAAAALAPVLFAAFVALRPALGRHPGEVCAAPACHAAPRHMT